MSELKKELSDTGRSFGDIPIVRVVVPIAGRPVPVITEYQTGLMDPVTVSKTICPYYRKAPFNMFRCMGATLTGKCGHPDMICPITPTSSRKIPEIIEVD